MARSMGAFLMGLMPASVTHPWGKRSRAVTWMTLMRPSWRMSRQPRHDRAHLGGAALHQACGQGGQQRTRQRRGQAQNAGQNGDSAGQVVGADDSDQEAQQRAAACGPGKLLLVFIAGTGSGAAGPGNHGRSASGG